MVGSRRSSPRRERLLPTLSVTVVLTLTAGCTADEAAVTQATTALQPPVPVESRPIPMLPAAPSSVPASSSGPLVASILPTAQELGPAWRTRVEGTDLEEGVGNGTAYQERDPAGIVETTIPMGCARRTAASVPTNVLQATYRHEGTGAYAVALRMRFASATAARQFAAVRHADLEACRDQPDDKYSGAPAPVLAVARFGDQTSHRYRLVGEKAVWLNSLQRTGKDILTIDSDAKPAAVLDWEGLGHRIP